MVLLSMFFSVQSNYAQRHDNVWTLGYNSCEVGDSTRFGGVNMQFERDTLSADYVCYGIPFQNMSTTSISNASGELRLMYNGCTLYDGNNMEVEGSETLVRNDTDVEQTWWCIDGYNVPHGAVLLPNPYDSLRYYLLYRDMVEIEQQPYYVSDSLYAASIYSDGVDSYVEWKDAIVDDTVSITGLSVVKHANGVDWWIMLKDEWENLYYKVLIDDQGISHHSTQYINDTPTTPNGGVPKKISPDGKYMVTVDPFYDFELFEVDRFDGTLTPYLSFAATPLLEGAIVADLEFSSSGEYLYVAHRDTLYQFDMTVGKEDFYDSRIVVGVRDTFVDPFPTNFWLMQRAPDGKIYMCSRNSSSFLHVIHKPDEKGQACEFENNGLSLPVVNASAMPYFPNFRLGPDAGWVSTTEQVAVSDISVYPNPTSDRLHIKSDRAVDQVQLWDVTGRLLKTVTNQSSMSIGEYPAGLYIVKAWQVGEVLPVAKLVTVVK